MVAASAAIGLHVAVHALVGQVERAGNRLIGGCRQSGVRPRIESGRAAQQLADGSQQEIILHRIMRCTRGVRPCGTPVIVALGAQIDVDVCGVFTGEGGLRGRIRAGEFKIVGRRNRVEQLHRIRGDLVRVVADDASLRDVIIIYQRCGRITATDHRKARGTGVADPAGPDVGRACTHGLQHGRHDGGMAAGRPFLERRRIGVGGMAGAMAAAADGGGHFNLRNDGGVIRIGGMIGGRTVTVLTLHTGQQRGRRLADKSGRQLVTHRVAGQAGRIALAAVGHKGGIRERTRMGGLQHRGLSAGMTFGAVLGTGVMWRWTRHPEESIARSGGNRHLPVQVACADGEPGGTLQ